MSSSSRGMSQAGAYLRLLRERAGLSSIDVWQELQDKHSNARGWLYAGVEEGTYKLPEVAYGTFARLVGVDPQAFAKSMLFFLHPEVHALLWGHELMVA